MTYREKLIELLENDDCPLLYVLGENMGTLADHLISNGVTVQEWISVKDRLPEPKRYVACIRIDALGIHYGLARYQHDDVWYVDEDGIGKQMVTHWMPLPPMPQLPSRYSNGRSSGE